MGKITLAEQAIKFHKEVYGEESFGVLIKDYDFYPKIADIFINRKKKKIYSNLDVEHIKSTVIHTGTLPVVVKGKSKRIMFKDGSGAFRIHLGSNEVVHIIRFILNSKVRMEYAIGTQKGIILLNELCESGQKKLIRTLPKNGIWKVGSYDGVYFYGKTKKNDIENLIRFSNHPKFSELENDFNQFFENLEHYTRYGQSGMRKILFTGAPGTGKTTIAKALAGKYQDKYTFVTVDDDFQEICIQAAKKKKPVIIIAEEADELYRANASTLNFLDGIDTPRNIAGTYIIFSTNYPKRIDPRIRKRPGRIDKVISVGAFRTKAAAECALLYLPNDIQLDERELGRTLDRTTPAEIKEIINVALGMIRGSDTELTLHVISNARKYLKGSLELSESESEEDLDYREEVYNKNGPSPDYASYLDD